MAPPPHPHHSTADRIATVVTALLAVLTAGAAVLLSPFFVMTTDACGSDNCDLSRLNWAYVVTWGGVALAAVLAVAGVVRAARRGTVMWIWPVVAIALIVLTFGLGFLLATSVLQQG
jgi:hypothetical protein